MRAMTPSERAEIDDEMLAALREVNRLAREGGTPEEEAASRARIERLTARIEQGR